MLDINWNPSPRELRQFAGIWLPAFAAIAGTLIYRSGGVWLAAVSGSYWRQRPHHREASEYFRQF